MNVRKRVAIATSAVAAIGLLGACGGNGSFKGSAKFDGEYGGTAQAQFKLICNVDTQRVSGALAYADPSAGALVIGQPTSTIYNRSDARPAARPNGAPSSGNACTDTPYGGGYQGTYVSLVTKTTGHFYFALQYNEECSAGFEATMSMDSGPNAGYYDDGCLTGGHITPIDTGRGNNQGAP